MVKGDKWLGKEKNLRANKSIQGDLFGNSRYRVRVLFVLDEVYFVRNK